MGTGGQRAGVALGKCKVRGGLGEMAGAQDREEPASVLCTWPLALQWTSLWGGEKWTLSLAQLRGRHVGVCRAPLCV